MILFYLIKQQSTIDRRWYSLIIFISCYRLRSLFRAYSNTPGQYLYFIANHAGEHEITKQTFVKCIFRSIYTILYGYVRRITYSNIVNVDMSLLEWFTFRCNGYRRCTQNVGAKRTVGRVNIKIARFTLNKRNNLTLKKRFSNAYLLTFCIYRTCVQPMNTKTVFSSRPSSWPGVCKLRPAKLTDVWIVRSGKQIRIFHNPCTVALDILTNFCCVSQGLSTNFSWENAMIVCNQLFYEKYNIRSVCPLIRSYHIR